MIPHGSYRSWYGAVPTGASRCNRILFFGHLAPYKGVEVLIKAFDESNLDADLLIIGSAFGARYARRLRALVNNVSRCSLEMRYVPNDELVELLSTSAMVALPFVEITNSGSTLLALDYAAPVAITESGLSLEARAEFGAEWVYPIRSPWDAVQLTRAYQWAVETQRWGAPSMATRDWDEIGRQYCEVYAHALNLPMHEPFAGKMQ
jgi:glycosyltransferase involved in cell wall biosynthesis